MEKEADMEKEAGMEEGGMDEMVIEEGKDEVIGGAGSKGIVEGLAKGVGVPCHIVVKPYHSAQWVRFEYGTKFCSFWPAAPFQGPGWPARSHRQGWGHRWPCCRHYI